MSRLKPLAVKLGLALASVLITLLAVELVIRLIVPPSVHDQMYAPSDDPELGVVLRAGAEFDFSGVAMRIPTTQVAISEQGLRDAPIEVPKPPGTRRLLCVGDSTTFGWGVQADECFCSLLDDLLGPDWETVNLGIPGYNTAQEVRRLQVAGLPLEPDLAIVLVQDNDYQPPMVYGETGGLGGWLVAHSALLRWVRIRLKSSAPAKVDKGTRQGVLDAFTRLGTLSASSGFPTVVFLPGAQAHAELTEHLGTVNLPWADVEAALEGADAVIKGDGHPNAAGHRALAALMHKALVDKGLVAPPKDN